MNQLELLLTRYPALKVCENDVEKAYRLLENTYEQDGKTLACGNGGSASDAAHIVGELMKSFVKMRGIGNAEQKIKDTLDKEEADYIVKNLQGTLSAISLHGELALVSAFANDVAPDMIFAQQVLGYGKKGDSLIAMSTSGNSANVVRAVQVANALGLHTIGLTGQKGGKLKEICACCICVPETETFKIQELHLPVYHTLCLMLEQRFFGDCVL